MSYNLKYYQSLVPAKNCYQYTDPQTQLTGFFEFVETSEMITATNKWKCAAAAIDVFAIFDFCQLKNIDFVEELFEYHLDYIKYYGGQYSTFNRDRIKTDIMAFKELHPNIIQLDRYLKKFEILFTFS